MTLSLPKSRKAIRQQEAVAAALRAGLKSRGIQVKPRHAKRDDLIEAAKCGRDPQLQQKARKAVDERRKALERNREVQKSIDSIAGRA